MMKTKDLIGIQQKGRHTWPLLFLALGLSIALWSCNKTDDQDSTEPIVYERGEIINSASMGIVNLYQLQELLQNTGIEVPLELKYAVEGIAVRYSSVDAFGEPIIVSGALFIPVGPDNLPLLSIQHGTETKRERVASVHPQNSVEGTVGLITASLGYFSAVPDYPGFGVSDEMHPYLHAGSLVPCVVDLMRAGKTIAAGHSINLNDQLFLTGYSEGGYVSLALQKKLEEDLSEEFNLTASAPLAGPYDLKGTIDTIFLAENYASSAYAGYFITAYNELYRWNRLYDIFQSPWAGMMYGLFNGSKSWGEINDALPENFSDLMEPSFIEAYNSGQEPAFRTALIENTLLDWVPQAPVHFFHGDADDIVPLHNALTALDKFTKNGAQQIQLTIIPGENHETAGPDAIFGALEWFEGFRLDS
jgi:pimeloyl-ACP methyl ester carboxylesterase